jgi:succinoglycan biosynthesis protein ExoO
MTPLVSLIMPAWRPRPEWLRQAVSSALAEQDCQLELIVVDDGSDEPVAALLEEVADPRVRVLRIEHAGPSAARNAGLAAAQGTHVRYVDADDVVEPGSTARLLALVGEAGDVIAHGATLVCDETLRPLRTIASELEGDVVDECLLGRFDVRVVSMLFPRPLVDRVGGWEPALAVSGDWDFVLRALELGRVRRDPDVATRYRRHRASVTRTADVALGATAHRLILDRYFDRHPERRGTALERQAYGRLHLDRALAHAASGSMRRAVGHFARAARLRPGAAASAGLRYAVGVIRQAATRAAHAARRRG